MSHLEHPKAQALLADAEISRAAVASCARRLERHLEYYLPLFYRQEQRELARVVIRGKLSNLQRKTSEPIAYPTVDPQTGTLTCYMTWHWPAYPNSFGPYWLDPDELPGQPHFTGLFTLPQINVNMTRADPNLSQSYHAVMNVALMNGSVRNVTAGLTQATWTNALLPNDGQVLGVDW